MPCDEYKRLELERKRSSERHAQFTQEKYRGLRGTSNAAASQIAREERKKLIAIGERIERHTQTCVLCKEVG